jgi:hypothetical protein
MASQRVFELADELTGGDIAIDLDLDWLLLRMHVDGRHRADTSRQRPAPGGR